MYFKDQPSVRYGAGEDLSPFFRLLFCLIDSVLCLTEASQFQEISFINCRSQCLCYWCYIQECVQGYFPLSFLSDSVTDYVDYVQFRLC